jgi:two-component system chemotaxis response regulator CheY
MLPVEGLEAVRNSKPDLIISDWNMPEMDGLSFLKALKSEASDIPFGFITTEGSPYMVAEAEKEGALFFVTKPFTADTIKDKLLGVLS